MENNEILERLLEDDKQDISSIKSEKVTTKSQSEVQISKIRIISAKYKLYIVLLLIFICVLLLIYIPNEKNAFSSNNSTFTQVNSRLNNVKREISDAESDMDYLCNNTNGIISNEKLLKSCLNDIRGCSKLPESWKEGTEDDMHYNLSVPLSYLQINSLWNRKMPVDEKRVLKNLNEYLIKQDISGADKKRVGELLKINIGDPQSIEGSSNHFFSVPVDVVIKFNTIGDLTGFLYNVEKKMIEDRENRILYKIQSVSYDIISNDEPQVTDISMTAYYYYDENIGDQAECGRDSENIQISDDLLDDEDSSDSDGFVQKILKSFKK